MPVGGVFMTDYFENGIKIKDSLYYMFVDGFVEGYGTLINVIDPSDFDPNNLEWLSDG